MPEPPPQFFMSATTNTLVGCLFFTLMAALSMWSMWQRRNAWGWWESPTTTGVILLSVGGVFCTPVFFFRNEVSWWGHAYMVSAILVFLGLASFAVTLKRRESHQPPNVKDINVMITAPTVIGITVIVIAYIESGAWRNPWLLDPAVTRETVGVRVLWTTVAALLAYLLSVIANQLLRLRADTRRGDRATITVYLASCFAGMGLAVIAVATAGGYGADPTIIVDAALLFGLMTGGKIGVGGLSWRRKVNRLSAPSRLSARVD